jgi:hypothetical protein
MAMKAAKRFPSVQRDQTGDQMGFTERRRTVPLSFGQPAVRSTFAAPILTLMSPAWTVYMICAHKGSRLMGHKTPGGGEHRTHGDGSSELLHGIYQSERHLHGGDVEENLCKLLNAQKRAASENTNLPVGIWLD